MVSIDTVYQKVLMFANKEQRGYITPQEFNTFADQAQKEIFEQYFYDLSQFKRIHGNSGEYTDVIDNINEKVAIFESTSIIVSDVISADDLYRLGTVYKGQRVVEEVQQEEAAYMNILNAAPAQKSLIGPTRKRPIYVSKGGKIIISYPAFIADSCTYVRKPQTPYWGYIVVNGNALYDSGNKTDFELHPAEETELVYKILKFAGVSMRRDDLTQAGQGLESTQVSQEKQ